MILDYYLISKLDKKKIHKVRISGGYNGVLIHTNRYSGISRAWFVCQDFREGDTCDNLCGFDYSWRIDSQEDIDEFDLEIKLINKCVQL